MFSVLVFICILSVLIVVHELGHFFAARRAGVRVEKFSLGFGPRLFKKAKGGTEYSVSMVALGGYVKLAGDNLHEYKGKPDEYFSQPPGRRFQIIFAGPLLNYVLAFFLFWLVFWTGYPALTSKVGGLLEGFGAKEAGIKAGDRITAIDGQKVEFWEDLQKIIQSKQDRSRVDVSILRDGEELSFDVRIKEEAVADQMGEERKVGLLGVSPFDEVVIARHSFVESFFLGVDKTFRLTIMTYQGLWRMATGRVSIRDSVTGPLGIFYITSKAARMGIAVLLHLMAVLSLSLGIFNLLPLPILDGGHILFLGIEKIRGRSLSPKAENIVSQIGLAMIITLALFVTYNDIVRIFGDKISAFLK